MSDELTVLYFGIYDPSYSRNWVIINGLKKNGVKVIECREKPKRSSLFKLVWRYIFLKDKFDLMIVGFPGQEIMFLAKFLTQKPIIFDAFTSHYGGYILDRKKWSKNSLRAKYFRFLDKWSCYLANLVLLDTQAHINFFVKEFGLPKEKFKRIWIGVAGENAGKMELKNAKNKIFNVVFFGTYIPLQGIEYIVRAAKLLQNRGDIYFKLIGAGQKKREIIDLAEKLQLKNVVFRGMLSLDKLREELLESDVCLGIFGNTIKANLVIPNKIYEALAIGKPIITSDTIAMRELFDENDVFFIPAANPEALAGAIIELKSNPWLMNTLAVSGHKKYLDELTYPVIGKQLKDILMNL